MTIEKVLICSQDNSVVVVDIEYSNLAEKSRKILEYRRYIEGNTYNTIINDYNLLISGGGSFSPIAKKTINSLDSYNTQMLNDDLQGYSFIKQPHKYKNELNYDTTPHRYKKSNTMHFNTMVKDSDVPEMFKQLGYKIEALDEEFKVIFDETTGTYKIDNFNLRNAVIDTKSNKMVWIRKHITYEPADYLRLQSLIRRYEIVKRNNPYITEKTFESMIKEDKDRSLFHTYSLNAMADDSSGLRLGHELKHIKNDILLKGLQYKKDYKYPSVEDLYRIMVEDERSAYLSQIINSTNKYLEKGDRNDFSMFDGEGGELVRILSAMPENERRLYVENPENLIKSSFATFEKYHKNNYDSGQFKNNLPIEISRMQISSEQDKDRSQYKLAQKLMYTYEIYNPQTGKKELRNLANYISDDMQVKITQEIADNLIKPNKRLLENRIRERQEQISKGTVDPSLVAEAKSILRDVLHKPRVINNVDDMEISSISENSVYMQTQLMQTPTPASYEALWSDSIKNYWAKEAGYREIIRNENEYKFNVKNATIKYESVNKVGVSENAEYDIYKKLLSEPSNQNKPVKFKDNLSKEQALKLYVACVNSGRKMTGSVPQDLRDIKNLKDISPAEMRLFVLNMRSAQVVNSSVGGGSHGRSTEGVAEKDLSTSKTNKTTNKIEIRLMRKKNIQTR